MLEGLEQVPVHDETLNMVDGEMHNILGVSFLNHEIGGKLTNKYEKSDNLKIKYLELTS